MAAADYDLLIEQGATFRFTMIYGHKQYDSMGALIADTAGNPIVQPYDLTGCKARMQIRQKRGSRVLISATTTNGGIKIDANPATGKMVITITDEATDALDVTRAKYDLEISYPSGDVVRILQGSVTISPNITQDADLDNISDEAFGPYDVDEQNVDADKLVNSQPGTAF